MCFTITRFSISSVSFLRKGKGNLQSQLAVCILPLTSATLKHNLMLKQIKSWVKGCSPTYSLFVFEICRLSDASISGSSQRCAGFDSQQLLVFHFPLFLPRNIIIFIISTIIPECQREATNLAERVLSWQDMAPTSVPLRNAIKGVLVHEHPSYLRNAIK